MIGIELSLTSSITAALQPPQLRANYCIQFTLAHRICIARQRKREICFCRDSRALLGFLWYWVHTEGEREKHDVKSGAKRGRDRDRDMAIARKLPTCRSACVSQNCAYFQPLSSSPAKTKINQSGEQPLSWGWFACALGSHSCSCSGFSQTREFKEPIWPQLSGPKTQANGTQALRDGRAR